MIEYENFILILFSQAHIEPAVRDHKEAQRVFSKTFHYTSGIQQFEDFG